ncbi:hypothetical protein C8J57DRAFT_1292990 [Mycena rebaudengoi]|nr:hypothetical protein C8J57DRAFT_1292990 [Mycena rebaudengoi]
MSGVKCVSGIQVFDWLCTLDQEVRVVTWTILAMNSLLQILYVWPRPWSISTILFVLNRYLPFVDTFLSLSARFTQMSPTQCLLLNQAVGWFSVIGIILSEVILMLRTYALWERKRAVLVSLCALAACTLVPTIPIVYLETASLEYGPIDGVGCRITHASTIQIYAYLLIMVSETTIAVLTAIRAYRDLRYSRVPWIIKLYQDGILFYVYLLLVSIANLLVPMVAPRMFANWLATPQRVLHSVLCTRVLLLILRRRWLAVRSSSSTPVGEEIFSSVVESRTEVTVLTTFTSGASSSRRDTYSYPVSPGAEEHSEDECEPRFNWDIASTVPI